ncbi:hypothetical protein [Streptomyces palmae]|uniref:hypothetical protein n=1 Tax=Streptomyces palmae TaxID=1701085 RepID=UPI001AE09081
MSGPAADGPDQVDPLLRRHVGQPHQALADRGDEPEAASRLARITQRLRPAEVAAVTGFHDQPHPTGHFKRLMGTTPGRYSRGHPAPGRRP